MIILGVRIANLIQVVSMGGSLEVFVSGFNMRGAKDAALNPSPFLIDFDTIFNGLKPIHLM